MGPNQSEPAGKIGHKLARIRPCLCRAVPAAAVFCFLAWCYVAVRANFSWDDAEPEILNQAWRFARGETIYRGIDAPPFTFAAYTPVYYVVTGYMMRLTGLSYLPAKLLSFLAALSICWAMIGLNRRWHGTAQGGIWASLFLFLIPAFLYNAVRSNVQMLAVAFSIWSLLLFFRNRRLETAVLSPLVAVLAFYTKQTQVALPLAMAVYLAFRNRRWLLSYASIGIVAGLVPLVWLHRSTHGLFLLDTVQLARLAYNIPLIPLIFIHHAGPICPFIGLALFEAWRRFKENRWEALDIYFGMVFVTTVISLGRVGAHGQYVLELLVVTMLYLLRQYGLPSIRGRDVLVSVQVLFLFVYTPLFIFLEEGLWDIAANRAANRIYPLLNAGSGPILSQQGSFALFARGEIYIQLFHFCGLWRAGLWDQGLLLKDIGKHTFSWVITEFPIEGPIPSDTDRERFTPEIVDALRANYQRRQAIYPYYLYTPRAPTEGDIPNFPLVDRSSANRKIAQADSLDCGSLLPP